MNEYEAERAVIDAAIEWHRSWERRPVLVTQMPLWDAVTHLLAAREPRWFPRTWRDVRDGDTVKMPGADESTAAMVRTSMLTTWHVHSGGDDTPQRPGRWDDRVGDHEVVRCRMEYAGNTTPDRIFEWPADDRILIKLTQSEYEAIELLGWSNRI